MWPGWPSTLSTVKHRLENYLPSVRLHKIQVLCWESSPREQHLTHFRPSQVANKFLPHTLGAGHFADCVLSADSLTHIRACWSQVKSNIAQCWSKYCKLYFTRCNWELFIPSQLEIIPIASYLEQSSPASPVLSAVPGLGMMAVINIRLNLHNSDAETITTRAWVCNNKLWSTSRGRQQSPVNFNAPNFIIPIFLSCTAGLTRLLAPSALCQRIKMWIKCDK